MIKVVYESVQWSNGDWYISTETYKNGKLQHSTCDCTTFRTKELAEHAIKIRQK